MSDLSINIYFHYEFEVTKLFDIHFKVGYNTPNVWRNKT